MSKNIEQFQEYFAKVRLNVKNWKIVYKHRKKIVYFENILPNIIILF